jgi:hypothetical protein
MSARVSRYHAIPLSVVWLHTTTGSMECANRNRGFEMFLPGFVAESSLYYGNGHYRSGARSHFNWGKSSQVAVPSYQPGAATQAKCNAMAVQCRDTLGLCLAASLLFPPGIAACNTAFLGCNGRIPLSDDCCPVRCEFDIDLSGVGCCDRGEQCVGKQDPNSRGGCCPAGQAVCGGKCCPPGQKCCGGSCCPSTADCCGDSCGCHDGMICQSGICGFPSFGDPGPPPADPGIIQIPKPPSGCPDGWFGCLSGTVCCKPGTHCCASGCDVSTCIH